MAELRGLDTLIVRGLTLDQIGDQALDIGVAVHELAQHAGSLGELFLTWTETNSDSPKVVKWP